MKRAWCLLVALLWLCAASANAASAASAPIVRTQLTPANARVGQTLTLSVDVLVPGWFTAPIIYPELTVDGVAARLSEQSGGNLSERIGTVRYAGIRRDYLLSAAQAGRYTLPLLALNVSYNDGATVRSTTLRTPPRKFAVTLPAGAENLGYFIATPRYTLTQTLDRTPEQLRQLKVGDSITRRLVQRADNLPAMTLPALQFGSLAGLAVYPAEPQLSERGGERGSTRTAERIDAATYLLRAAGKYELPALKIAWYDPAADRLRWASAPALRFEVAASPAVPTQAPLPADTAAPAAVWQHWVTRLPALAAMLGPAVLLTVIVWRWHGQALSAWRSVLLSVWRSIWRSYAEAEATQFRRCRRTLRRAVRAGDAALALRATRAWLSTNGARLTLEAFAARHGDTDLHAALAAMEQSLYGPPAPANANALDRFARLLPVARRHYLRARRTQRMPATALMPLNPR
jgi:hypothetical protein